MPTVVEGPAAAWQHITVVAGEKTAEVPPDLRAGMAPLLASRAVSMPQAPAEYGLDRPQAQLSYRAPNRAADVLIGSANFDRHFFYVERAGRATVYLVPADSLRPVLVLIGIEVAPPD